MRLRIIAASHYMSPQLKRGVWYWTPCGMSICPGFCPAFRLRPGLARDMLHGVNRVSAIGMMFFIVIGMKVWRLMRAFRNRVSILLSSAVVIVLAVFAIGNVTPVRVQFAGQFFPANLWWIVAGSALLGALFSFILPAPGRVAAGWRNRTVGRAAARRDQDVRTMQEQHQQLQAQHSVLQAQQGQLQAEYRQVQGERDEMHAQLVADRTARNRPSTVGSSGTTAPEHTSSLVSTTLAYHGRLTTNRAAEPSTRSGPRGMFHDFSARVRGEEEPLDDPLPGPRAGI